MLLGLCGCTMPLLGMCCIPCIPTIRTTANPPSTPTWASGVYQYPIKSPPQRAVLLCWLLLSTWTDVASCYMPAHLLTTAHCIRGPEEDPGALWHRCRKNAPAAAAGATNTAKPQQLLPVLPTPRSPCSCCRCYQYRQHLCPAGAPQHQHSAATKVCFQGVVYARSSKCI
jgi:hypothetical protein